MQIANPMYDVVFKYLLDDNKIAKKLISLIIAQEIETLDLKPTEIRNDISQRPITVLHIDFCATIKLKIPCKKELLETMRQYSLSAQYALDTGWDNGIYFKKELHHLTYYPIRETLELPAQLICSSRDKACESLKALRKAKKPTKPQFKE
ncbi:MAG: hypothetical protein COB02_18175, partial [Candidatus Cloacimonadota bacterium]